ncbi:DGQHR domain-containing protein [Novosphingobium sp. PhB165]|uniref:DGQHR domain-containing protein n=1 Tax=Novosphingobium sp. PhB165 TaxID=2485105 RepID=UPI0010D3ACC2|nr:DGQHR domain-containing protein [Novosphingobium sp. PhB165]TCM12135.1 DGQHR domain-containing protein [Novosphingobium sp. PhB165]
MAKLKKKTAPKILTPDQARKKIQSEHRTLIRSIFRRVGFTRVTGISDQEFTYDGQKSDFDDVFVYENVILFFEYTTTNDVGGHLKPKKILYDKIDSNPVDFVKFLREKFPDSADQLKTKYHDSKLIIKIIYCSRYEYDAHYQDNVPNPAYFDYHHARYFASVTDAVKKSALQELLNFLKVDLKKVGADGQISVSTSGHKYPGSLLPEAHSNFDDGYKVVSFYADPAALLKTSYVLRKDGWHDSLNLYQRMISKAKIEAIRAYLKKEKRVFINNIIVTLPSDVQPVNSDGTTINAKSLTETAPITIQLPNRPNSIGLIDGQHRVFAYYEGVEDDSEIASLRKQQNLLVTGIIYPKALSEPERQKFEARLFLEINSTQTSAKSPLKQAIGIVLEPYSTESIAARTLSGLAKSGPLSGFIQQYFYETEKLKTASIVSYGLKPLVKTSGTDSIFSIWQHPDKEKVSSQSDLTALEDYVKFCVRTINIFLVSVKKNLDKERWTTDKKTPKRVLATTYINSFLITLRLLIDDSNDLTESIVTENLKGLNDFDFSIYHSSQYARMAEKIIEKVYRA